MYEIAEQVQRWLTDGTDVHVAQIVGTTGFSSRDPAAALAWTDTGEHVGALLSVIDPDLRAAGAQIDGHLAEVDVTESDAAAAGLSCGGVATVLVQAATGFPADTWDRLIAREPLCLVTEIAGAAPARTDVYGPATIRDAAARPGAEDLPRLFARGFSDTQTVQVDGGTLITVALWPVTTLVVVGDGLIAGALADTAEILGWTVQLTNTAESAAALVADLHSSDAVVVLSHDRAVDAPALAAALSGKAGYVGALGSRRTQLARREWLTDRGLGEQAQARIYGPAGLDIDAHTPGEIAISIVAEILGARSAGTGGSLRDREGPVHRGGVSAPPPRYAALN